MPNIVEADDFVAGIREFAGVIKDRVDIVQHIGKYEDLKKKGSSWQGPHSSHSDNKDSTCFSINLKRGYYNCFSCGEAGDVITFEQKRLNVEPLEAMKSLANEYGIAIPNFDDYTALTDEERERIDRDMKTYERVKSLQEKYCQLSETGLLDNDEAMSYLKSRGLNEKSIKEFRLGYAYKGIGNSLIKSGFTQEELQLSGLFTENYQILSERILIPTLWDQEPCHFVGRTLDPNKDPKYLSQRTQQGQNRFASVRTLWSFGKLSDTLEDKKTLKPLLICEGSIDALLAAQKFSKKYVVASGNTTILSQEQTKELTGRLYPVGIRRPGDVVICNDNDENKAGFNGALRTIDNLRRSCLANVLYKLAQRDDSELNEEKIQEIIEQVNIKTAPGYRYVPEMSMAILRKPRDEDKVDLSDYITSGRISEASYWINAAITPEQYEQWLISDPDRFFRFNDRGRRGKIIPKLVANEIHFEGNYFHNHNETLFQYDEGVYVPCIERLRVQIENKLGIESDPEYINKIASLVEVMSHDKKITYDYKLKTDESELSMVNTESGWLDFDKDPGSHEPIPHSPFKVSFSKIPVHYDKQAGCPVFWKFIAEVLEKEDVSEFIKLLGYLPVRTLKYAKAFMFVGIGGNGKSTAIETLQAFLGDKNYASVPLEKLENNDFSTASLVGKLANFHADLPMGYMPSSSVFKALVTGDSIDAEEKYKSSFNFAPESTLVFSANEIPRTGDTTYGYYRRWSFLAFDRKFSDTEEEDPDMKFKLSTPIELSGLLNLAWVGYFDLKNSKGFVESERSKDIKEEYTDSNDIISAFVREGVETTSGEKLPKNELYNFFKAYLEHSGTGKERISAIKFNRRIRQLIPGIEETSDRCWQAIAIKEDLRNDVEANTYLGT